MFQKTLLPPSTTTDQTLFPSPPLSYFQPLVVWNLKLPFLGFEIGAVSFEGLDRRVLRLGLSKILHDVKVTTGALYRSWWGEAIELL
jgi:hypothetical protein